MHDAAKDYDLFVIGAGSGGVRAARIAASHGASVAIAEEFRTGGTCVIRGCVPKKLLVYGAHFAEDLTDARHFGWSVDGCRFDWPALRDSVASEVSRLEGLYANTLMNAGVDLIPARARVTGPNEITLQDGEVVQAKKILVATGARPFIPDIPGSHHGITSNDVFQLPSLPNRIAVVGGGYIANEFAGIFNEFGSKVTVVNRSGEMLRGYDEQLRDRLIQISREKGINFRFHAKLERVDRRTDGALALEFEGEEGLVVDCVLFAAGRVPNSGGLGLSEVGVDLDDFGAIIVNEDYASTVPTIFAVGDVINRVQLTPVAIREGHAFADNQFGGRPKRRVDYTLIPSAVFSHPPIASIGMTERQARDAGLSINVYTSDFRAMKNVLARRDERALYKMVCDADTDQILGLHMIGPDAPEILQAAAVAVKARLTKQAFDDTVALHPTMSEELVLLR